MSISESIAYDKDRGGCLNALAKGAGIKQEWTPSGTDAVQSLLASGKRLILVHLLDSDWQTLLDGLAADRAAVRFSTAGFAPRPAEGEHSNGFRCKVATQAANGQENANLELTKLAENFTCSNVKDLRSGFVPDGLRAFISFKEPEMLRAAHILLQGCLAEWASDDQSRSRALKALGLGRGEWFPRVATERRIVNRRGTFLRCFGLQTSPGSMSKSDFLQRIGDEIGLDTCTNTTNTVVKSMEKLFLEVFKEGQEGWPCVSLDVAISVFEELSNELDVENR